MTQRTIGRTAHRTRTGQRTGRYRLCGNDLARFKAYEQARRTIFRLVASVHRRKPSDDAGAIAARYGLDPLDVRVALRAVMAREEARR